MRPRCDGDEKNVVNLRVRKMPESQCVDIVKLNIYMQLHIRHHNILAQGRASYFGFLRSSTHESVVLQCIEMLKCWLCTFLNRCCL